MEGDGSRGTALHSPYHGFQGAPPGTRTRTRGLRVPGVGVPLGTPWYGTARQNDDLNSSGPPCTALNSARWPPGWHHSHSVPKPITFGGWYQPAARLAEISRP